MRGHLKVPQAACTATRNSFISLPVSRPRTLAAMWSSRCSMANFMCCLASGSLQQLPQPLLRVGPARAQVHAAVAQVAQHLLHHAAAVLGRQAVERAREGMREVRLVDHAV